MPVRFFGPDGRVTMSFCDTYWSLDDYLNTLRAAGFSSCRHFRPARPCDEEVAREVRLLQSRGAFPRVPFQDYNGEPTVIIVATK